LLLLLMLLLLLLLLLLQLVCKLWMERSTPFEQPFATSRSMCWLLMHANAYAASFERPA